MVNSTKLWVPNDEDNQFVFDDLSDALALYLPIDCSLSEHDRVSKVNQLAIDFCESKVTLEEYMDALADLGIDAEIAISRVEWQYSQALSLINYAI